MCPVLLQLRLRYGLQAAEQPEKRVPLLTSSTESFKVGLKSYAQLHGPKHISIPSNGYIHAQSSLPLSSLSVHSHLLPMVLRISNGLLLFLCRYPAAQDLSPVKKVRGTKATASTAQVCLTLSSMQCGLLQYPTASLDKTFELHSQMPKMGVIDV